MGNRGSRDDEAESPQDGSNSTLQNPVRRTRRFSRSSEDAREMKCPTCHGKGTVTVEEGQDAEQLIALIPYKDKRLKPRRTVRNIVITIIVCTTISALLLFFLLPRSVTISISESPKPGVLSVSLLNVNHTVQMAIQFGIDVKNKNFLDVDLTQFSVTIFQSSQQVEQLLINESFPVGSLKTERRNFTLALTFLNGQGKSIENLCAGDWRAFTIELMFDVSGYYSYFSDKEMIFVTKFYPMNVEGKCSHSMDMDNELNATEL